MPEDLKVGVFICECGGNISDTVDIQKVKDSLNVEVVEQFVNLCSLNGRKIIRDAIFDSSFGPCCNCGMFSNKS